MSDVTIRIGGREFRVSCREGEEEQLHAAAEHLDAEAAALAGRMGRLPEAQMLLMAGLMLADRTAGLEQSQHDLKDRIAALERELAVARDAPEPEKVEVAVIPDSVTDTLAEIAARAEALAECLEEQTA